MTTKMLPYQKNMNSWRAALNNIRLLETPRKRSFNMCCKSQAYRKGDPLDQSLDCIYQTTRKQVLLCSSKERSVLNTNRHWISEIQLVNKISRKGFFQTNQYREKKSQSLTKIKKFHTKLTRAALRALEVWNQTKTCQKFQLDSNFRKEDEHICHNFLKLSTFNYRISQSNHKNYNLT